MTDVTYSGEYFNDAEYDTAMHLFVEESQKDIADAGVETVHGLLQSSTTTGSSRIKEGSA